MNEAALLNNFLVVGGLLFAIGLVGFIVRRNMIVMFLSVEIMLQGVSTSFIAWSRYHDDWGGQMLVVFIIAVAACEAAIGLALVLMLTQKAGRLDIAVWQESREPGQPPYVDEEVPEERREDRVWPTLTPAGVEPKPDERQQYRTRI